MSINSRQFLLVLRFILIIPVAILVWFLILYFGILVGGSAIELGTDLYCPGGLDSDSCELSWRRYAIEVVIATFAGISAVAVVLTAGLIAPLRKFEVCFTTFLVGTGIATYFASLDDSFIYAWIASLTAGAATTLIVKRRWSKTPDST